MKLNEEKRKLFQGVMKILIHDHDDIINEVEKKYPYNIEIVNGLRAVTCSPFSRGEFYKLKAIRDLSGVLKLINDNTYTAWEIINSDIFKKEWMRYVLDEQSKGDIERLFLFYGLVSEVRSNPSLFSSKNDNEFFTRVGELGESLYEKIIPPSDSKYRTESGNMEDWRNIGIYKAFKRKMRDVGMNYILTSLVFNE